MRKVAIPWVSTLLLMVLSSPVLQPASGATVPAIKPTLPCVQNGLTISTSGHAVTLQPGSLYIDDRLVTLSEPKEFEIPKVPGGTLKRLDELYITPSGVAGVAVGIGKKFAPEPAVVPAGSVILAQLAVRGDLPLTENDILTISRDGADVFFADRDLNEKALAKTLAKLRNNEPVRILFWGDSITCGSNASKPELGYAALTEQSLRKRYPKANITIKNLGIGGSSIVTRLPSITPVLTSFKPDMVLIEFINDIQFPIERIEPLYERVHEMSRVYGFEVLYVDPFFPNPGLLNLHTAQEVSLIPYFKFVRTTARQYGWALADAARRWQTLDREGTRSDLLMEDGVVHLNNRGHLMLSEEVYKCFR